MLPTLSLTTFRRTLGAAAGALLLVAGPQLAHAQSGQPRSLETAFGPVKVSAAPQRVITLDEGALDTAIALGITPVGSVAARGGTELPAYLQDHAAGVAIVGTTREPNLEAILSQRPDLILAPPGLEQRVYAVLSKIAPTVVTTETPTAPWEQRNALYAAALGKEDEMARKLDELRTRISGLRDRLPRDETFSVVRWNPQGPLAMSNRLITGQILTALGLKGTDIAANLGERPHSDILSLENLGAIDADRLFIATLNEQGEATLAAARQQPAFNRLSAVRNDHSYMVDGQVWTSATGIMAAHRILDDVERILVQ